MHKCLVGKHYQNVDITELKKLFDICLFPYQLIYLNKDNDNIIEFTL